MTVASSELEALVRREHSNPHSVLGAHPQNGGVVIRVLRPAANSVTALIDGQPGVELKRIHPGGVFEGVIEDAELPLSYRLEVDYGDAGKYTIHDPYSFLPTLGELDQYLIGEGRHEELYEKLGAHVREIETITGTGPGGRILRRDVEAHRRLRVALVGGRLELARQIDRAPQGVGGGAAHRSSLTI